jgi:hypothetical protein
VEIAISTTSLIINEVCDAIKAEFAAEVIQCPTTTEEWTAIAEQFEKRWQFPHCCGALDGKHVAVSNGQLETRRERLSVPCVLLYSAFYPSQDLIVEASGKSCVVVEGLL